MSLTAVGASESKPNIILILADDLGYMDLVAYAARIKGVSRSDCYYETPHLNRLMNQSVVFTQAYASPLCSPTRSSLITGKYAARQGFMTATPGGFETYYNQGVDTPPGFYDQDGFAHKTDRPFWPLNQGTTNIALPQQETSIAEALPNHQSGFLGKWHLGGHGSAGFRPSAQGFEEIAWFDAGGSPYFNWRRRWDKKDKIHAKMSQSELECGLSGRETGEDYLTDDLSVQACRYIEKHQSSKKPFLLYFCHFAVHTPLQAKKEDIRHFSQKKSRGWNGHSNPTYAAMLKSLDDSVGAMMKTLKETRQDKNTVIIFMSDNGGIIHPNEDGVPTVSNNAPLKGEKALLYEGGIRVPMFIWSPKKWNASLCDVAVDCNDVFPTLLDVSGESLDHYKTYGDGQSLLPLLQDPKNKKGGYSRDTFFWHYPYYVGVGLKKGEVTSPRSAVRKGDWKLILNWEGAVELYNIKKDLSESKELSKQHPERTKELLNVLMEWIDETVEDRYIPQENPRYKSSHAQARSFSNIFSTYGKSWPKGRASRVVP